MLNSQPKKSFWDAAADDPTRPDMTCSSLPPTLETKLRPARDAAQSLAVPIAPSRCPTKKKNAIRVNAPPLTKSSTLVVSRRKSCHHVISGSFWALCLTLTHCHWLTHPPIHPLTHWAGQHLSPLVSPPYRPAPRSAAVSRRGPRRCAPPIGADPQPSHASAAPTRRRPTAACRRAPAHARRPASWPPARAPLTRAARTRVAARTAQPVPRAQGGRPADATAGWPSAIGRAVVTPPWFWSGRWSGG